MPDNHGSPLPGFDRETKLADELGVNPATLARKCKRGLFEYILWGGEIYDNRAQVLQHVRSLVQRRNPPRRPRRQSHHENRDSTA
jgi:hypothetical protein